MSVYLGIQSVGLGWDRFSGVQTVIGGIAARDFLVSEGSRRVGVWLAGLVSSG